MSKITLTTDLEIIISAGIDAKKLAQKDTKARKVNPANWKKPSQNERLIHNEYEEVIRDFHDQVEEKLIENQEEMNSRDLRVFELELDGLPNQMQEKFDSVLVDQKDIIIDRCKRLAVAEQDLLDFRVDNDLKRAPELPKNQTLHYAFLATILLGESLANAQFFAKGAEGGLLEGAIISLLLSGLNFLLASMLGVTGIRNLNHIKDKTRNWGALFLILWLLLTFFVNLGAAHYRTNINLDALQAAKNAALGMLDPFNIPDIKSWLLFLFGLFANGAVLTKQLKHQDIYPGYIFYGQKVEEAREKLQSLRRSLSKKAQEIIVDYVANVSDIHNKGGRALKEYSRYLSDSQKLLQSYPSRLRSIEDDFAEALQDYRNEVSEYLREMQRPSYFDDKPTLMGVKGDAPSIPIETYQKRLNEMKGELGAFHEKTITCKKTIENHLKPLIEQTDRAITDAMQEISGNLHDSAHTLDD